MKKMLCQKNKGVALFYEKANRSYEIQLMQDLFDSWLVIRLYGNKRKPLSHQMTEAFDDWDEAYDRLLCLHEHRSETRSYRLVSKKEI